VALSKLMLMKANVMLLDEPTNHLDLMSREVLEAALEEYDGTLVFVSHDRYFLNRIADRIVEMSPDGAEHFLGNYDEMVAKKQQMAEWDGSNSGASRSGAGTGSEDTPASSYEAEKQAKREDRARARKREQTEADIARLEQEIAALQEEMASPEVSTDYVALREKQAEAESKQSDLDEAYAAWEALMEE